MVGVVEGEVGGQDEGDEHGDDFGHGIHAPPEPAEDVDGSGAGTEEDDVVEGLSCAGEEESGEATEDEGEHAGEAAGPDEFFFARFGFEEAAVEVVDEIGGAEIDLGGHGGHVGGDERGGDDAHEARREEGEHRGVGGVICDQVGVGIWEGFLDGIDAWEDEDGGEGDEDPRPGAEGVVGDIEEKGGSHGVAFVLGGEHALGDVAAASGLGAGEVGGPPLDGEGDEKDGEPDCGVIEVREDGHFCDDPFIGEEGAHASDALVVHEVDGGPNGAAHGEGELDEIGEDDAPESTEGGVDENDEAADGEHLPGGDSEDDLAELDGGETDHSHDEDVEDEAEIEGAESPQEGGFFSAVAELVELDIGHDAGASPEFGKDKDGDHSRDEEGPPAPVCGDSLVADELGDEVWGVGGESGGDHGDAEEPPGHAASGKEELGGAFSGLPGSEDADAQRDEEEACDDGPVEGSEERLSEQSSGRMGKCGGEV